jgi:hypothetical protein
MIGERGGTTFFVEEDCETSFLGGGYLLLFVAVCEE